MAIVPKVLNLSATVPLAATVLNPTPLSDAYLEDKSPDYTMAISGIYGDLIIGSYDGYEYFSIDPITGVESNVTIGDTSGTYLGSGAAFNDIYYLAVPADGFPINTDWLFGFANIGEPISGTFVDGPDFSGGLASGNDARFNYKREGGGVYSFLRYTPSGVFNDPTDIVLAEFTSNGISTGWNIASFASGDEANLFYGTFQNQLSLGTNGFDFGLLSLSDDIYFVQANKQPLGAGYDFEAYQLILDADIDLTTIFLAGSNDGYHYFVSYSIATGNDLLIEIDPTIENYTIYDCGFETLSVASARRTDSGLFLTGFTYPDFDAFAFTFGAAPAISPTRTNSLNVRDAIGLPCFSPCRPLIIAERILKNG